MDEYAVLVFREQRLEDDQQMAFTLCLGDIEHAIGTSLRGPDENRLPTTFADVSNLDRLPARTGAVCSPSAINCGIPTVPSRRPRRSIPC
jgi:hypothetical protein